MIVGNVDTLEYSVDAVDYALFIERLLPVLQAAKLDAQANKEVHLPIDGINMLPTPAGIPNYAYGLKCEDFWVYLAGGEIRRNYPIRVKVRSGALWSFGLHEITEIIRRFLQELEFEQTLTKVSRVDLAVDTDEIQLTAEDRARFITRADKVSIFEEHGRFTGFQVGAGDPIMLRIYDKTTEIIKSGKDWMTSVWEANGWCGERVWRVEFQCRREVLRELGVETVEDLESRLTEIWAYLSTKWFRLKGSRFNEVWNRLQKGFGPISRVGVRDSVLQQNLRGLNDQGKGILRSIGAATNETDPHLIAAHLAAYADAAMRAKGTSFGEAVKVKRGLYAQAVGSKRRHLSPEEWSELNTRLEAKMTRP